MTYDFETLVPSLNAESPMRRKLRAGNFPDDIIDYGVAEMKFPLFPDMEKAMVDLVKTGVLGYSAADHDYYEAVCGWMSRRHGWTVLPEEINQTYGVVESIGICVRAFSAPGDNILIQTPVYNPFAMQIRGNGRNVIENQLVFKMSSKTADMRSILTILKKRQRRQKCSYSAARTIPWAECGRRKNSRAYQIYALKTT